MFNVIFENFINPEAPCPGEIPFCEEWRAKYLDELHKAEASGCTSCKKLNIKSHFMQIVYHKYMENLKSTAKEKQ